MAELVFNQHFVGISKYLFASVITGYLNLQLTTFVKVPINVLHNFLPRPELKSAN